MKKKTKKLYRRSAYGRVKGEIKVTHGDIIDFGKGIRIKVSKGITTQSTKMSIEAPRSVPITRGEAKRKT